MAFLNADLRKWFQGEEGQRFEEPVVVEKAADERGRPRKVLSLKVMRTLYPSAGVRF